MMLIETVPSLPLEAYRTLVEQSPVPMLIVREQKFCYANPAVSVLLGYSTEELIDNIGPLDIAAPEDRDLVREQIRRRRLTGQGSSYEASGLRKDGSRFFARITSTPIDTGPCAADLVTLYDISEIKDALQLAQQRSELLSQTEALSRSGACEYDVASAIVTQSAGMYRIFGEPPSDARVSGEWLMTRVPAAEEGFVRAILEGVQPGEPCEFEHRILHTDGEQRTVLHRCMAEADTRGRITRVVSILRDISAQRTAEQQRDQLALSDSVTGLPNRSSFLDQLHVTLRHAQRTERSMAMLLIQINQLKLVTDSFGLADGDKLLAEVADRISYVLDARDTLAHLGSGQFAVLPTRRDGLLEDEALALAHAVVQVFENTFSVDDNEFSVTCGVGVATFPHDDDSPEKLLHKAQAAMLRSQELGDNRVCVYSPDTHAKVARRLAMQTALRRALERGEFSLSYQPQLDLASGAMIGVEALLRWTDATGASISPVEFIAVAEETGLIVPIGEWVLRTACEQSLAWRRAGLAPLRMAVNLSMRQLQQPDIATRVQAILLETGLDANGLGIEITENVLMAESAHVAAMLHSLKSLGIEISLDDFGTGYSNLSYLRELPIDIVKVDRSFVHDVTAPAQSVSMTRAVITMAHSLQMKVLAEGVETEGQLALLMANRCDQMQGYFFSPPVDADTIAQMLRERRGLPEYLLRNKQRQRTLLLVDDEGNVIAALKRLLRQEGYNIVTASSGAEGLQRLAEHVVDVIVSDQRMPGMTGVEFLRRAKALYPDTVRMVLSGYTEFQSITDAVNEGSIYKFLTKPWDDERLRGHIGEAFRLKEMADENRRLSSAVMEANQDLGDVNQRLQDLLSSQREQISREDTSLTIANELLDAIPAPLIGIDPDGMVAFLSANAEALFAEGAALLGRDAATVLPACLRQVWEHADGSYHAIQLGTRRMQAACSPLRDVARARQVAGVGAHCAFLVNPT